MYFKATKYRSFQRQCGLWGFHRQNSGALWHQSFARGWTEKLKYIIRTPLKNKALKFKHVPGFYHDNANSHTKIIADKNSSVPSGNSGRDEEFLHLDKEFEAWLHEIQNFQKHASIVASDCIPLKLNCKLYTGSDNQVRGTKAKMDPFLEASDLAVSQTAKSSKTYQGGSQKDFSCRRNAVSSPHLDVVVFTPDQTPSCSCRENVGYQEDELDQVELDELSNFIDMMIQQLP